MRPLLRELWRRSPILTATALLHVALLVFTVIAVQVDQRTVLGINTWTKPAKFMASISVYLFTVAWLVGELKRRGKLVAMIAVGISMSMVAETVCLFIQAVRGTTSHYNLATPFDGAVFGTMGLAIALDTVLMILLLALFLKKHDLAPAYLWGIRSGIAVFLLGSWIGGQMISAGAHTVGAPDGGPGLPLVNWSTVAGDLRIAHALGLHGLQVLPLIGLWISRRGISDTANMPGPTRKILLIAAASVAYLVVFLAMYVRARAGSPLLS